ncbi:MAG: hypothetical protein ACKPH7_26010 [Planktothrix sp.]|uniref:hypothetical protein n=1 Tax=Planktothrix sp. TaxID=3088171 RepID=UPI0038D387F0
MPLAVIEAKDNHHGVSDGMQQAIATAKLIDVPFIFSCNSCSAEGDRTAKN